MFRLKFLVPFDFTHFRTRPNNQSKRHKGNQFFISKYTLIYNKCLTNFSHNQGNINATILQKYCRFKSHGITRKMQIGD